MKFFIPFTIGRLQAEEIYDRSKKRPEAIGLQVSGVCIQQVTICNEDELVSHQVGEEAPNGEVIATILQSDMGYFVCTFTEANEPTKSIPVRYMMLIMDSSIVTVRGVDP